MRKIKQDLRKGFSKKKIHKICDLKQVSIYFPEKKKIDKMPPHGAVRSKLTVHKISI